MTAAANTSPSRRGPSCGVHAAAVDFCAAVVGYYAAAVDVYAVAVVSQIAAGVSHTAAIVARAAAVEFYIEAVDFCECQQIYRKETGKNISCNEFYNAWSQ